MIAQASKNVRSFLTIGTTKAVYTRVVSETILIVYVAPLEPRIETCNRPTSDLETWHKARVAICLLAVAASCAERVNVSHDMFGRLSFVVDAAAGILSAKSVTAKKNKSRLDSNDSGQKAAVKTGNTPARAMLLMYVKVFVVAHMLAFSFSESPDIQTFFQMCGGSTFPQAMLYPKMIKHCVTELYSSTISRFSHALRDAIAGTGGAVLHANFDLWTSRTSNENYIGESVDTQVNMAGSSLDGKCGGPLETGDVLKMTACRGGLFDLDTRGVSFRSLSVAIATCHHYAGNKVLPFTKQLSNLQCQ